MHIGKMLPDASAAGAYVVTATAIVMGKVSTTIVIGVLRAAAARYSLLS